MSVRMETWSPGQAAAARAMILARTQQEAAKPLGISQQAVSQAVQAAHRPELAAAEAAIGAWLSEIPMRPPQQENPE